MALPNGLTSITAPLPPSKFPAALLEWAGHRSGGVRRLFYKATGRPAGDLIETPLLTKLRAWAASIAAGTAGTPRIVLLVGGPGNGKSEAVEETIRALEHELGRGGELESELASRFSPRDGSTVPRLVRCALTESSELASRPLFLTLVQDASVADPSRPGRTPAVLLMEDLVRAEAGGEGDLYLACVNRGILDDALIAARADAHRRVRGVIESVVRAAGVSPEAPTCWPLAGHPAVAIWPMDVESLIVDREEPNSAHVASPAAQVLSMATDQSRWPVPGTCAAGEQCPFCRNRALLASDVHSNALLHVLRWYELATGKRWSFRDLLSLISFLLAGAPPEEESQTFDPCAWAKRLLDLDAQRTGKRTGASLSALFTLVASQYQHALFGVWPRIGRRGIKPLLRELQLADEPTLLGLHHFLINDWQASTPGTLRGQLISLCQTLDPALADPSLNVSVSARSELHLRELDARFSHSVHDGLKLIGKYHNLSALETDLLKRLGDADDLLGSPEVRRRKPTTATRLQTLVRDFACRLVRRSIGTRAAVVRDVSTLRDFERVVSGDEQLLYQAAKQVEALLNDRERFVVNLNTTFGEPTPPEARRVTLQTPKQRVRPRQRTAVGRPNADLRFLEVGGTATTQSIPLTFDLFRAVRELQGGMLAAALPRTVTAALDATRARLAGRVVRDEEELDGAEIRIGIRDEIIVREMGRFLVRSEREA